MELLAAQRKSTPHFVTPFSSRRTCFGCVVVSVFSLVCSSSPLWYQTSLFTRLHSLRRCSFIYCQRSSLSGVGAPVRVCVRVSERLGLSALPIRSAIFTRINLGQSFSIVLFRIGTFLLCSFTRWRHDITNRSMHFMRSEPHRQPANRPIYAPKIFSACANIALDAIGK